MRESTSSDKTRVKFTGRILFLTDDTSLIRQQLEAVGDERERLEAQLAESLLRDDLPLMSNISTDEITPGWVCFYYDETLGEYVYVGMREAAVKKDEVKNGGFAVVVSGLSKGCGSSRETAPYAEKAAGIQLVIAKSIEKIYGQNSQNIGLLTSTDLGLVKRIRAGAEMPFAEFTDGLDPISRDIVEYGGLFNYNKARLAGEVVPPPEPSEQIRFLTNIQQLLSDTNIQQLLSDGLFTATYKYALIAALANLSVELSTHAKHFPRECRNV